jgi:peptidyl-tRNA hydrolase
VIHDDLELPVGTAKLQSSGRGRYTRRWCCVDDV